jgi:hypothetical protein
MELMRTDHEFLLYGLWVAAIACLGGALLFAGLSALFAVVNTATTPIGTATGVPGLYLWNSLASECKLSFGWGLMGSCGSLSHYSSRNFDLSDTRGLVIWSMLEELS